MINQDQLNEIVKEELTSFNKSIGWIDPDDCSDCEDYPNDGLLYYEIDDGIFVSIRPPDYAEDSTFTLWNELDLVVNHIDTYDDWEYYRYEFKLPNLSCLESIESFRKAFKESVASNHKQMRVEALRKKIRLPIMGDDKVLEMEGAKYVDFRFYLGSWDYEILNINKEK